MCSSDLTTNEVDNYPGFPSISGFDLSMKLRKHADDLLAVFITDTVNGLSQSGGIIEVLGQKNRYKTRSVIIATGAVHKKLEIPGEEKFSGRGVSYCATCDGMFFKDKTAAIAGGGDVALEDAAYLSRICKKVYIIHRRDTFRGAKSLQEKVFNMILPMIGLVLWSVILQNPSLMILMRKQSEKNFILQPCTFSISFQK